MDMTPKRATLLVLLLWGGIYLGGLGIVEMTSNEMRRVEPAMVMLQTGDWLLPELTGEAYFNKPPLINWMIAGLFALAGGPTEFLARLPAALVVLAFVLTVVAVPCRWLSLDRRLLAALLYLMTQQVVGNGREASIDGMYAALLGMAVFLWLTGQLDRWHPAATWGLAGVMLGGCLLLKGPLALVFFYAIVGAVLWARRDHREWLSPWHGFGLLLMLAIFFAWALPMLETVSWKKVVGLWRNEMEMRFEAAPKTKGFPWGGLWLKRVAGAVAGLAPAVLAVPLFWRRRWTDALNEQERLLVRGLRLAAVIPFVLVNLMPETKSRYALPVLPLVCLLAGWCLPAWESGAVWTWLKNRIGWRLPAVLYGALAAAGVVTGGLLWRAAGPTAGAWWCLAGAAAGGAGLLVLSGRVKRLPPPAFTMSGVAASLAGVLGAGIMIYSGGIGRWSTDAGEARAFGARIESLIPTGTPFLFVTTANSGFKFYIHRPIRYTQGLTAETLPPGEFYFLMETRQHWRQELELAKMRERVREPVATLPYHGAGYELWRVLPLPPGSTATRPAAVTGPRPPRQEPPRPEPAGREMEED